MAKKKTKEIDISLKEQFNLIDVYTKNRVISTIKSSYYDSRLSILIGMWKKGEVVYKAIENDKEISYREIERQTDRDRRSVKQWHEIYMQDQDLSEYIEKVAKKKALEWTDKVLKANENKKLFDQCYEGFEEYKEEVKEKIIKTNKIDDKLDLEKDIIESDSISIENDGIVEHQCTECVCEKEKEPINIFNDGYKRTYNQIEWVQWSWHPVIGCTNDCFYCSSQSKFPDFRKPKFFPDLLNVPKENPLPDSGTGNHVFVCQDSDLFCDGVPDEWIDQVLKVTHENPQWKYLFLSKYPERMSKFIFPKGSWVGVSVDQQELVETAQKSFDKIEVEVRFLCCEPLLEPLDFKGKLTMFDWLIVGALVSTGSVNEMQPEWIWVEDVFAQAREANLFVYFKPSLKVYPKEFPK